MEFRVLGPLTVVREDEPLELGGLKQRAVLAMLLMDVNRFVSTDRLLEAVWGDTGAAPRHRLWVYVSNLRSLLEPERERPGSGEILVTHPSGYELKLRDDDLDATRFERLVEEGRVMLDTDPLRASEVLREALGEWRGRAYEDFTYQTFAESEIRRLEELRLQAVELRVDADLAAGRHETLITEAEALAEEHLTRERFRAQHMLSLYRSGRQAEALRAYRRTEGYLLEELGIEPSQELQDLELAILEHDPQLEAGSSRATTQRLALLVTDMEQSNMAWDRWPQAMAEALTVHDRILGETIEDSGGRVFRHTGEGVLAVFPDAVAAADAAEKAQFRLAETDWGEIGEVAVRMGIDVGEAESRGGDFHGPPLNRAARLAAAGHGGQVLVSAAAQTEIAASGPVGIQIRQLGEHLLRGLASPQRIGQLVFVGLPADFPDLNVDAHPVLDTSEPPLPLPGYELRSPIGKGPLGVLWGAFQPSVGREVAIKVIRPDLAGHPGFARGFEAEARTIARLAHPHIVPLIDFWRDSQGAYLVFQLLPAGSLNDLLATGEVESSAARRVLRQVGEALDHVHAHDVVHRDIHPANVLLDTAGNAYLSEFGIAARLIDPELVGSGSAASKYRAPEQKRSGPSPAADRYALGVLASDLVGGDPDVDAVIGRATAPDPEDRYPSAAAFFTELEKALGDEPAVLERPPIMRNPYKGLRAFDESDAADFYGRDELVSTLLAAVERHRFVTVVGPSGSGKSSVVRAGLLPALASGALQGSEQWSWAVLTPGSHPVQSLVQTLKGLAPASIALGENVSTSGMADVFERVMSDMPGELVLVLDQFEELFTLVDDQERRHAFLELLVEAVEAEHSRVRVVATLRADFYHRPLALDRVGRLVRDGLVTVLPPTWDELVEMITHPANAVGLRWEPGLPERIAQEVIDQPGGLPLLQFGLSELVERRRGEVLTSSDYQRVGGVAGALANRAEALYGQMTPIQQDAARQLLLRLVTVDEETETTRRRVRRSELESLDLDRQELESVLEALTAERLLLGDRDPITRGPTVEVAHETLLVEWRRLREWIDQQRESLLMGRRLRRAIEEWTQAQRHPDCLLTGSRLAPFLAWEATASLTTTEKAFLEASRKRDDAEETARTRRRRVLTGVLAGAGLVAAALATVALIQAQRAGEEAERAVAAEEQVRAEANRARAGEQLARSRELAASAVNVLDEDPELSVLLALAAAEDAEPTFEEVSALHEAVQRHRTLRTITWPAEWGMANSLAGSIGPNGRYLAVSGGRHRMAVWDIDAGIEEPIWSFELPWPDHAKVVPRFTDDGSRVVATAAWFNLVEPPTAWPEPPDEVGVYVFDTKTGRIIRQIRGPNCPFNDLKQSSRFLDPAGLVVATAPSAEDCSLDQVDVWLLDLETGESRLAYQRPSFAGHGWDIPMSLSDNGRLFAFSEGPTSRVVDLESGEVIFDTPAGSNARLNRDGTLLLTSSQSAVELWELESGVRRWRFEIPAASLDYWFNVDESLVYGGGFDGTVQVLDARTGEPVHQLNGHPTATWFHSMTSDNARLASFAPDRTIRVWDVAARVRGEIAGFDLPGRPVLQGGNLVDGRVAMITYPQEQRDFLPAPGRAPEPLAVPGEVVVLDTRAGGAAKSFPGYGGRMVRLSPDGRQLAGQPFPAPGVVGPVHIRDVDSGEVLVELEGLCGWDINELRPGADCVGDLRTLGQLGWLDFSPDGSMLAVSGQTAGVWDAQTGQLLVQLDPTSDIAVLRFSPASDLLVMATDSVSVMETETWSEIAHIPVHGAWWDLTFTEDGSRLLAVDIREGIIAIDTNTWEYIGGSFPLAGHQDRDLDVSSDGSMIATGGPDGFVRISDAETGELLQAIPVAFPAGSQAVTIAEFLDDRRLFIAGGDDSAAIVTTDVAELIELARSRLTRGFSAAECETFNFGDECPTLEELRGE